VRRSKVGLNFHLIRHSDAVKAALAIRLRCRFDDPLAVLYRFIHAQSFCRMTRKTNFSVVSSSINNSGRFSECGTMYRMTVFAFTYEIPFLPGDHVHAVQILAVGSWSRAYVGRSRAGRRAAI
jgi:hypothetical protein